MQTNLRHPQDLFVQRVRYEIPRFQRRYVWEQEKQWEPLWDDVEALAQSIVDGLPCDVHFMGAIVLQQKPAPTGRLERRIVVDGQQRLITLQLLINAIQEVLEHRQHSVPAMRLKDLVANARQYWNGNPDNAFKVWPTGVDRDAFKHAMSNDLSVASYTSSRIVHAHDYFKGQTAQWLDRVSDDAGKRNRAADALEEVVSQKIGIVVIDLDTKDDRHVIFETLNARGTPLLQSDMVKNKILQEADTDLRNDDSETSTAEKHMWPFGEDWWAEEVGRGLQRRPRVDVYLNHWLTLRNQQEMKPYDEFRAFTKYAEKRKTAGDSVEDVAQDLSALGNIYRCVEKGQRADIATFLKRRDVMNVGVATPLLLWLLSTNLSSGRLANCLKALESFLVRRVVCGYSARGYGKLFVRAISKLSEGSADNADRILVSYLGEQEAQASLWPNDKELHDRFVTAPLYKSLTRGRLRMVLAGIEEELRTNKAESHEVLHKLQIEHIMPQSWFANWPLPDNVADVEEATERRKQAIHTIGNLTLVNDRLNPSLSNASWGSKRTALADHSILFLNKRLVNDEPNVWDETAIVERAEWLHEVAVRVWPHGDDVEVGD